MPAGVLELMSGEGAGKNYNYGFWTEGQPNLNNRKLFEGSTISSTVRMF